MPKIRPRLRPIEDFPGYFVGNDGSVWSCWKTKWVNSRKTKYITSEFKRLKPRLSHGYPRVSLYRDGKAYDRVISRLVLEAFVGPCPEGMEACHDPDRTPTNCKLENLRWDTRKGNMQDCIRHGMTTRGIKNTQTKLTEEDVIYVVDMLRLGVSQKEIAEELEVHYGTIYQIASGKNWSYLTGITPDNPLTFQRDYSKQKHNNEGKFCKL